MHCLKEIKLKIIEIGVEFENNGFLVHSSQIKYASERGYPIGPHLFRI